MNELKLDEITIDERYQIRGRISTGSYAEVFVARDLQNDGSEVVIKALNTDLLGTPDFGLEQTLVQNFEMEASILEPIALAAKPPDVRKRLRNVRFTSVCRLLRREYQQTQVYWTFFDLASDDLILD